MSDEGDVYMWEGRSDYFPAEGRQPGSGSKKPGSGSATKARLIPGGSASGGGMRLSLGGEVPLGSSFGAAAECGTGSYGSHSRRPGSYIERFAREREASGTFGTSPAAASGLSGSYGAVSRPELSFGGSANPRASSRASDVFEKIRPER